MNTVVLSGEPKSTQHIYGLVCSGRFPRRYMTDQGRALKEQYQWEAKSQWRDKPLKGEVRMHVTLYFGTKRLGDWGQFPQAELRRAQRHPLRGR